jgi:hypothetical protein
MFVSNVALYVPYGMPDGDLHLLFIIEQEIANMRKDNMNIDFIIYLLYF